LRNASFKLQVSLLLCLSGSLHAGEGGKAKPMNLDNVNTAADEDDPYVTMNHLELYYAAKSGDAWRLMTSQRTMAAKPFPAGKLMGAQMGKDADERSPFWFAGKFYFATNWIPDAKFKNLKNFDLKQKNGTQAPLPLLGVSEAEDELHPWIAAGGKEFYFSRRTKEGWMLFVANGPTPGPIGEAKAVGFPAGYHHATVSGDGLVMYLQGPLEGDRWGIFRCKRGKLDRRWGSPVAMVSLNDSAAPRGDMSPCLHADGKTLYFVSDRAGGKGGLDIWSVPTSQLKSSSQ
jgi:hypothetical protein